VQEKQDIAICYDENFQCHQMLLQMAKVSAEATPKWQIIVAAILGGVVTGMVADSKLHH